MVGVCKVREYITYVFKSSLFVCKEWTLSFYKVNFLYMLKWTLYFSK